MAKDKRRGVAGTPDEPVNDCEVLDLDGIRKSDREDGKWYLCFDFNAVAVAEKATGLNLLIGTAGFLTNSASMSEYIGLLYAFLLRVHPTITFAETARLIRFDQLQDVRYFLIKAINLSLPEKKRIPFDIVRETDENDSPTDNSGNDTGPSPESTSDLPTTNSTD